MRSRGKPGFEVGSLAFESLWFLITVQCCSSPVVFHHLCTTPPGGCYCLPRPNRVTEPRDEVTCPDLHSASVATRGRPAHCPLPADRLSSQQARQVPELIATSSRKQTRSLQGTRQGTTKSPTETPEARWLLSPGPPLPGRDPG